MRSRLSENEIREWSPLVGVVSETIITLPGSCCKILVECCDGRRLEENILTSADMVELAGCIVIVTLGEDGRYRFHWGSQFLQRAKGLTKHSAPQIYGTSGQVGEVAKRRGGYLMSEAEYKTLPGADHLPLYDADDERCEQIERPNGPAYYGVREATELGDALDCTGSPHLDFRGGIKYRRVDGIEFVCAYFWLRR
jgi:hypothetical protein